MSRENKQFFISFKVYYYVIKVDFLWCFLLLNFIFEVQFGVIYLYFVKRYCFGF